MINDSVDLYENIKIADIIILCLYPKNNIEWLKENQKYISPKTIITIIYVLGMYAKWLQEQKIVADDSLYQMIQSLDKKLLWKKAKPNAKKKFISYKQYQTVIKDIATYEEYNALYYELLFSCIWFGIYSDDLSVIKNLRSSNIGDDGVVTLEEDNGHTYKLKIPIVGTMLEKIELSKFCRNLSAMQKRYFFGEPCS